MKFYTEGLINKKPAFSLKIGRKVKHYIARNTNKEIIIMWMEEKYGRRMYSFPCLILEKDVLFHYANKSFHRDYISKNEALVKRWKELVTPENIHTDYIVEELEEYDFSSKFRKLRDGGHSGNDTQ
ncbi:MAG: hypothetical protein ACOX1Q_05435 [Eubacteriales bacterium]